jgi:carboxylate-amine ligase
MVDLARHFGESARWSVGAEEELFVVDATTLAPANVPESLLDGSRRKPELFRSLVELTTTICESAREVAAELARLRTEAVRGAAGHGLRLAAAGTHPLALAAEQEVVDEPGLRAFAEYAGPSARMQYCCGLHVHVGVASAEACLAALEAVLPWLPVVLALSVNSPYFEGRETGLASTRAELLTRLPRTGAPPAFDSFSDWETFASRLVSLGLADDYTRLWWDVRPHPRLGTLEVRMPDQPTRLELSGAFVALIQGLVASAEYLGPADRGLYDQNRWAALRFGRAAQLVHPDGSRLASVPELADELLERVMPVAQERGSAELLAPLELLARRSQAEEQLELGRVEGLDALTARLVEDTRDVSGVATRPYEGRAAEDA